MKKTIKKAPAKKTLDTFKFVGRGASYLNSKNANDLIKEDCKTAKVKLVNEDSYGIKQNVIVKQSAKKSKNGYYAEHDVVARFNDGDRCHTFLSGMCASVRIRRKKR